MISLFCRIRMAKSPRLRVDQVHGPADAENSYQKATENIHATIDPLSPRLAIDRRKDRGQRRRQQQRVGEVSHQSTSARRERGISSVRSQRVLVKKCSATSTR